ncbi:hypothetical protein [Rubritalea tangerina]
MGGIGEQLGDKSYDGAGACSVDGKSGAMSTDEVMDELVISRGTRTRI